MSAYTKQEFAKLHNQKYKFADLSSYIEEMNRLIALKKSTAETAEMKMRIPLMLIMLGNIEKPESIKICETYYKIADLFLGEKIKFWEGVVRGEIPDGTLEKLQEQMTDYLEASWAYFGMEKFKAQGEETKKSLSFCVASRGRARMRC